MKLGMVLLVPSRMAGSGRVSSAFESLLSVKSWCDLFNRIGITSVDPVAVDARIVALLFALMLSGKRVSVSETAVPSSRTVWRTRAPSELAFRSIDIYPTLL